jgi:hypothetical protein
VFAGRFRIRTTVISALRDPFESAAHNLTAFSGPLPYRAASLSISLKLYRMILPGVQNTENHNSFVFDPKEDLVREGRC